MGLTINVDENDQHYMKMPVPCTMKVCWVSDGLLFIVMFDLITAFTSNMYESPGKYAVAYERFS
jgi:hypothetical protein